MELNTYASDLANLCQRHGLYPLSDYNRKQTSIYAEMLERNTNNVVRDGAAFDACLASPDVPDTRRCFASYCLFNDSNFEPSEGMETLWKELADAFPTHTLYKSTEAPNTARLHYTYLQNIGFADYIPETDTGKMRSLLRLILENTLGAFEIVYCGVIPLRTGIVMVGFPSTNINASRDVLRKVFPVEGVEFKEPYINDIIHSTVLRFSSPLDEAQHATLLSLCERYRSTLLGRAFVSQLEFGPASWRMTNEELGIGKTEKVNLIRSSWISRPLKDRWILRGNVITHRGLDPERCKPYGESALRSFADQINRGFSLEFDPLFSTDNVGFVCHHTYMNIDGTKHNILSLDSTQLDSLGVARLADVIDLIKKSPASCHSVHLKGDRQSTTAMQLLVEMLTATPELLQKVFIFDATIKNAASMKQLCPDIQLGASLSHEYDIQRYNACVYGTLLTVEQLLANTKLYSWAWLDEWDTADANGQSKRIGSTALVAQLHAAGLKVATIGPDLHATSPGLLGGESHADGVDVDRWHRRIQEYIAAGVDAICTDWPEQVYEAGLFGPP